MFCGILQFIHGGNFNMDITNITTTLQAATFFGVDAAFAACHKWALSAMSSLEEAPIEVLNYLPMIYLTAKEIGVPSIANLCAEFLAIHFVEAVSWDGFTGLPFSFLSACINNPLLTVESEMQLCEALFKWHNKNEEQQCSQTLVESDLEVFNLFKKIRTHLLPLGFLLRQLNISSNFLSNKGGICAQYPLDHEVISRAIEIACSKSDKTKDIILKMSPDELVGEVICLRLTKYSKVLDICECQQVTESILFLSAVHAPASWACQGTCLSTNPDQLSSDLQSFGTLQKMVLSGCWRLKEEKLVAWLGRICPNLSTLKVDHCPQLQFSMLLALSETCRFIETADFSLEIDSLAENMLSVISYKIEYPWRGSCDALKKIMRGHYSLSSLKRLFLQGRIELTDKELFFISRCCPNLQAIDLSGCRRLTDTGISIFIKAYSGMQSISLAGTELGPNSTAAILSSFVINDLDATAISNDNICQLTKLDLASLCRKDLAALLSRLSRLTHLNLENTNLDDASLLMFRGTSLEQLNVRETQVSGCALAHVLALNSGLRALNIRGCKQIIDAHQANLSEKDTICTQLSSEAHSVFEELGVGRLSLQELKVGWGLSDLTFKTIWPCLPSLKAFTLGIGGRLSSSCMVQLSALCPALEELSLAFQDLYGTAIPFVLKTLLSLRTLEFQCCMNVPPECINAITTGCGSNLTSLMLENSAPWLLDIDVCSLSRTCKNVIHFSLSGCRQLTAESLKNISRGWCSMIKLKVEDCGGVTSQGATYLLNSCKALQSLSLRHSGRGLPRAFISDAASLLPLLRSISLDVCDAINDGYDTPHETAWQSLCMVKFARCTLPRHSFKSSRLQSKDLEYMPFGYCHNSTIVLERTKCSLHTTIVKERL
ncbi:hypothetical protein O6H91_09G110100 [Diphasiastrum complanatum]|uniref:Uncharacterized protein n=1 Tax=Diphasiastrum complanatum TaxID=34168 RepID=A0ACC2CT78_DIPCM|nr:hypothetical protein O6H91_09G110100 [Diphasiastrum complanatum]